MQLKNGCILKYVLNSLGEIGKSQGNNTFLMNICGDTCILVIKHLVYKYILSTLLISQVQSGADKDTAWFAWCFFYQLAFCVWSTIMLRTQREPVATQRNPLVTQREPLQTQHKPVEYNLRWGFALGICVCHADFMLFVLMLFALGSQRKYGFWWNMGFRQQ